MTRTERVGTLLGLLILGLASLAAAAPLPPIVLSDFETDADLARWAGMGAVVYCSQTRCDPQPAVLSRVSEHATSGAFACRIDAPAVSFPGMALVSLSTTDWSAYDNLCVDVYNPSSGPLGLVIALSDRVHGSLWVKRHDYTRALLPGANHVRLPLAAMVMNDGSGNVDPSCIEHLSLYLQDPEEPATVFCDYIRLEDTDDDPLPDAARNVWKFDFGSATSPVWPAFFRVVPNDTYPVDAATKPFGFTNSSRCATDTAMGPDDLYRDSLRSRCPDEAYTLSFRVDLPNGAYSVYALARNTAVGSLPAQTWQLRAEGAVHFDAPITSAEFYTSDQFFRGLNEDYPLSGPAYDVFEAALLDPVAFDVTVNDGHLDLEAVNAALYGLVVYPISLAAEMGPRLEALAAARREQFEISYFIVPPHAGTFIPTPTETARGFAAWPVATMDPTHLDTLPPATRPDLALTVAGVPGERRSACLALRPLSELAGVHVVASDLADGLGHTIAATALHPRYVRYFPARNTGEFAQLTPGPLYWEPRILQDTFPITIPAQVTKQLWLDVTIPDAAPGGTYTGTVTVSTSAGNLTVPLTLEVWPLSLASTDNMSYGFYYLPPDDLYAYRFFPDMAAASDEMLLREFAFLHDYGFNAIHFPSPTLEDIDPVTGHVGTLDTSPLERFVNAMRATGFGGNWKGQWITLSAACCIYQSSAVDEFDANHIAALQDVLRRMEAWSNSPAGVPLVEWILDEPREDDPSRYANFAYTIQYVDILNGVPETTPTLTLMYDSDRGVDYTRFVDGLDVVQPLPAAHQCISKAAVQHKPVWLYNTGGDLRVVYGFYNYACLYEQGGTWEWHFNWLDTSSFDPFPYSPFNAHWHYTYPSPDGPVPTLKLAWGAQGIWDYRYAATLQQQMDAAFASGDPDLTTWAEQANALLLELKSQVPQYILDEYWRPTHFGGLTDPAELEAALDSYRRRIVALLLALPSPLPAPEASAEAVDLPDAIEWDGPGVGVLSFRNLQPTPWTVAGGYGLAATGGVDRWGFTFLPLLADVAPDGLAGFPLDLTAPPVTTLRYLPVGGVTTPVLAGLPLCLGMSDGVDPVPGGTVTDGIVISRFPDIQPGSEGSWARAETEACAGRVPRIVGGYPDGYYRPGTEVSRDQMAVYLQRALVLPTAPYAGLFPDVGPGDFGAAEIEALVNAHLVGGYPDGNYRPAIIVNRGQMAAFISRGLAGSDSAIPNPTGVPVFPDVTDTSPAAWYRKYVEYCVSHGVVGGYPDGKYWPEVNVNRGQMAVFVYRAFIKPIGAAVILAGPAVTAQDPATGGQVGWASTPTASAASPGYAYVSLDAFRLSEALAADGDWQVRFELRTAPAAPATGAYVHTETLTAEDIHAARAAAVASGYPHWTIHWDIPGGLTPGGYLLVVSVEGKTSAVNEVVRKPLVSLTP